MESILEHLRTHRSNHLEHLLEFLRIPSVSTEPEYAADVAACSKKLADHLQHIRMQNVKIMPTGGHPVVYADWLHAAEAPTILIYGHYDVQPPDPLDLWNSPPFEPVVKDGKIYARGASDDKGQFLAHVNAIDAYLTQDNALPVNVKLLFEGEEEIGSLHLHEFVRQHAELLQADAILISDGEMFGARVPSICYGTRGLVAAQIDLEVASRDLHSGGYGGLVDNPILVLANILAALKDAGHRVTVPGFYDDVAPLSEKEKALLASLEFNENQAREEIDATEFIGETGFSPLERRWCRPTLDANGILGGFTGDGTKTIIPSNAMAKVTMRLVPNQDPEKIVEAFTGYIQQLAPSTVRVKVHGEAAGRAYLTPLDHPILPVVAQALRQVFDREPVFTKTGGSIGVLSTFEEALNIPCVLVGLDYPGSNIHAPNEFMHEEAFYLGMETSAHLLNALQSWAPNA